MTKNSTGTVTIQVKAPRKEDGWCEAEGVEHAWEVQNYQLTTNPPMSVRKCLNCGKTQMRSSAVVVPDWQ